MDAYCQALLDAANAVEAHFCEERARLKSAAYEIYQAGLRQGKWLVQNTGPNKSIPVQPSMDEAINIALTSARPAPAQEKGEDIGIRNRFAIDWDCFVVEWAIEYIEKTADLTRKPEKADLLSALRAILARNSAREARMPCEQEPDGQC